MAIKSIPKRIAILEYIAQAEREGLNPSIADVVAHLEAKSKQPVWRLMNELANDGQLKFRMRGTRRYDWRMTAKGYAFLDEYRGNGNIP